MWMFESMKMLALSPLSNTWNSWVIGDSPLFLGVFLRMFLPFASVRVTV